MKRFSLATLFQKMFGREKKNHAKKCTFDVAKPVELNSTSKACTGYVMHFDFDEKPTV